MSQEKQEEYSQASSFVQNGLDEQTSTSDLDTLRQQKTLLFSRRNITDG